MIKKIIPTFLLAALVSFPVYAENTAELPHVESANGIYDLVDYEFYTYEDKEFLVTFVEYENTTAENVYPTSQFTNRFYQDGVALEIGISDYSYSQPKGKECKPASTELKPGGKVRYLFSYELESQSDIDVEIKEFMGDEILSTYTIPYGGSSPAAPAADYEALYNDLLIKYEQLQAEYQALQKKIAASATE